MAAIDKIYGTVEQWQQLHDFLKKEKPEFLRYMYEHNYESEGPLSNFSYEADIWMKRHCPLEFVQARLKEQYNDERLK